MTAFTPFRLVSFCLLTLWSSSFPSAVGAQIIAGQQYNYEQVAVYSPVLAADTSGNEWIPLTRQMIRELGRPLWEQLEQQGHTGSTLASLFWAEAGIVFELAVLESLGVSSNQESFNGAIPDAVGRILNGKFWQGWPIAVLIEVKISNTIPSRERDQQQLLRMIDYLRGVGKEADVRPVLLLVTPAGSDIKPEIVDAAGRANVSLLQATVEANVANRKVIRVGAAKKLTGQVKGLKLWRFFRWSRGWPAVFRL